ADTLVANAFKRTDDVAATIKFVRPEGAAAPAPAASHKAHSTPSENQEREVEEDAGGGGQEGEEEEQEEEQEEQDPIMRCEPRLAEFLGTTAVREKDAMAMVLEYLKANVLFDPKDYAYVVQDDKLRALMGEDRSRYKVKKLARRVHKLLEPLSEEEHITMLAEASMAAQPAAVVQERSGGASGSAMAQGASSVGTLGDMAGAESAQARSADGASGIASAQGASVGAPGEHAHPAEPVVLTVANAALSLSLETLPAALDIKGEAPHVKLESEARAAPAYDAAKVKSEPDGEDVGVGHTPASQEQLLAAQYGNTGAGGGDDGIGLEEGGDPKKRLGFQEGLGEGEDVEGVRGKTEDAAAVKREEGGAAAVKKEGEGGAASVKKEEGGASVEKEEGGGAAVKAEPGAPARPPATPVRCAIGAAVEMLFEEEWWDAHVIESRFDGQVKVHYVDGEDDEDEWVSPSAARIRPPQP
ncbi:hypothetical protein T484DRAFT_1813979, partial [Baffinella frigidus]